MESKKPLTIYWLKRDFRLQDNPALTEAIKNDNVLILYIVEPSNYNAPEIGDKHVLSIITAYNSFKESVEKIGGQVYFAHGEVVEVFENIRLKYNLSNIIAHEEIGNLRTYKRDEEVRDWAKKNGIPFLEFIQTGVFRNLNDRDKRSALWKNFYFDELLPSPTYDQMQKSTIQLVDNTFLAKAKLTTKIFPEVQFQTNIADLQRVTEDDAQKTLRDFLFQRGEQYSGGISSPNSAFVAGSRLSVHLAWGTISGRFVYQKTLQRKNELMKLPADQRGKWVKSLTAFTARLHWRDHFIQRLETEPEMEIQALNEAYEAVIYDATDREIMAWADGNTGFPMVDACIRCLKHTGFVNFRMRAMITSFACHVLHIDWKILDPIMAKLYTDYEPGIHISQLQMQASVVGINTIRVYNPTKQIIDQDPDCIFIKEWLPELRSYSPKEIIAHNTEPLEGYIPPIVDYKLKSAEMRSQLYSIKGKSATKELSKAVYEKHGSRKRPKKKKVSKKAS